MGGPSPAGRTEPAAVDHIQRLVDRLGAALGLPVSVDDERFRLQFYSPQQGTLDRVRIESILFRDSPPEAKAWVRAHGVEQATGPVRVPRSDEVGLLPRVGLPIPHQGTLLGYLWIIDSEERLDASGLALAEQCAQSLGPLLYRRRYFDRLDRQAERDALSDVVDARPEVRRRGAEQLAGLRGSVDGDARVVVVRPVLDLHQSPSHGAEGAGVGEHIGDEVARSRADAAAEAVVDDVVDDVSLELALELALERARALLDPGQLRFFRRGAEGVVLLTRAAARPAQAPEGAAIVRRCVAALLPRHRIVLGVGSLVTRADDVARSHDEARDAAEIAVRDTRQPDVLGPRLLGVHRELLHRPEEERELIVRTLLGALIADRDGDELLRTLRTFLDRAGDVVAVAAEAGLHRSSVYGRIRRIEGILGVDLSDGTVRLALHRAVVAHALAPRAVPREGTPG